MRCSITWTVYPKLVDVSRLPTSQSAQHGRMVLLTNPPHPPLALSLSLSLSSPTLFPSPPPLSFSFSFSSSFSLSHFLSIPHILITENQFHNQNQLIFLPASGSAIHDMAKRLHRFFWTCLYRSGKRPNVLVTGTPGTVMLTRLRKS